MKQIYSIIQSFNHSPLHNKIRGAKLRVFFDKQKTFRRFVIDFVKIYRWKS